MKTLGDLDPNTPIDLNALYWDDFNTRFWDLVWESVFVELSKDTQK